MLERPLFIPPNNPNYKTETLEYFSSSNWKFYWENIIYNPHKKPKINNNQLTDILPKQYRETLQGIIELKSIIQILKDEKKDDIVVYSTENYMNGKDIEKIAKLEMLENAYSQYMKNIMVNSKIDDKEASYMKIILFLAENFDYNNASKQNTREVFVNAFYGTASQIGVEKESLEIPSDLNEVICEENKDNLNYFGRKILEHKQNPKSKEEFILDLKNYAKTAITSNEIEILFKMYNLSKPPSLLNKEHKELIKETLVLANAYSFDKISALSKEMQISINSLLESKNAKQHKPQQKEKNKSKNNGLSM